MTTPTTIPLIRDTSLVCNTVCGKKDDCTFMWCMELVSIAVMEYGPIIGIYYHIGDTAHTVASTIDKDGMKTVMLVNNFGEVELSCLLDLVELHKDLLMERAVHHKRTCCCGQIEAFYCVDIFGSDYKEDEEEGEEEDEED